MTGTTNSARAAIIVSTAGPLPPGPNHKLRHTLQTVSVPGMRIINWLPPYPDHIKLNFDGGYSTLSNRAIRSGIFRRSDGTVLLAFTDFLPPDTTCYDGEATALLYCIQTAFVFGFRKIWVEGDAKFLVETVNGRRKEERYDPKVVEKIKNLVPEFESCDISFLHREGNRAADGLVEVARRNGRGGIFTREADLPPKVREIVACERNGYRYIRYYESSPAL